MEIILDQTKVKNLSAKIILANIIDIAIPSTPAVYSYYVQKSAIFEFLSLFELIGIVYLIFNMLTYSISKGSTIGENLNRIHLIDINTDKKNHIKDIFRILFIAGLLFYFQTGENFNFESIAMLFFLLIPVKFNYKGEIIYSILNLSLKIQYINRKSIDVKENNST